MARIIPDLKDKRMRGLVLLAGFTFLFVILAMLALTIRTSETLPQMPPQKLFPDLDVNAVAKVIVATAEGTFEVTKTADGKWIVPSKANYPAKFDTIKKTVLGVASLEVLEAKTSRKDWHEQLELGAPEEKGKATSLTFQDASGKTIAAVLVGKVESYPGGSTPGTLYIRRPAEDQTWLARGTLTVERLVNNWVETDLFKIRRDQISRAEITPEGAAPYTLLRDNEDKADFAITAIPAGKEPTSASAVNGVGSSLVGMTFDDVKPVASQDFSKASHATFTTFDGLVVVVTTIKKDDKYWATIAASANPPPPPVPAPAPAPAAPAPQTPQGAAQPPAAGAPATPPTQPDAAAAAAAQAEAEKAAAAKAEAVKKDAEAINARTNGFAFNLPKFKGDSLTTKLETLLKEKGAAPATPSPATPPGTP